MRKLCLLAAVLTAFCGLAWAGEEYPLGPDSQRQPGVPQGTVTHYTWTSKIFPGTVREYWVYVPAQYAAETPACVMFFEDGKGYVAENGRTRIPIVFDNLIAKHEMPVTIAILIDPGVLKGLAPGQQDRVNRSYEYDGLSDRYARFLLDEILPEVSKHYDLSTNPDDRAISGASSGGICSFTVAWTHPEAFHRVLSNIGSFTDLRGGDIYPALIRKTEPKPLRILLQDGNHDLNNFAGSWWLANQSMASALAFAGYDVKFVTGNKDHDMIQGGSTMPDALRWLWRDYPRPIAKAALRPMGDPKTGFHGVDSEWQQVFGTNTTASAVPESPLQEAAGIAVDPAGRVFFTEPAGEEIREIDLDGTVSVFASGAGRSRGLAFGPAGKLYACAQANREIVSYTQEGARNVVQEHVDCQDLAVTRAGGIYFTQPSQPNQLDYVPPAGAAREVSVATDSNPLESLNRANGISLSFDESMLYICDRQGRWVWAEQVGPDGSLSNSEPFFRLEIPDEIRASGAAGAVADRRGLLFVASLLGIQVCDQQGRVVAILNPPDNITAQDGPVRGVTIGGPGGQYLYVVAGSKVFRRHLTS